MTVFWIVDGPYKILEWSLVINMSRVNKSRAHCTLIRSYFSKVKTHFPYIFLFSCRVFSWYYFFPLLIVQCTQFLLDYRFSFYLFTLTLYNVLKNLIKLFNKFNFFINFFGSKWEFEIEKMLLKNLFERTLKTFRLNIEISVKWVPVLFLN